MAMDRRNKRLDELSSVEVQRGNSAWWTRNPMAYDWTGKIKFPRFSREWYQAIDAEFLYGSRLFATLQTPFDRIIPISELRGARVLEIGCGMGLHTQTMAAAGAEVTAIDLTPTAVEATSRRLALKGLRAQVLQPLGDGRRFGVRARNRVAQRQQDFGDTAHADPADANQMNALEIAERNHHETQTP